jgi:hypothetical protein
MRQSSCFNLRFAASTLDSSGAGWPQQLLLHTSGQVRFLALLC